MGPIPRSARLRKALAGLSIAFVSCIAAILLSQIPLLRTMEWKIYDLQFRTFADASRASRDIVLVKIDDVSIERMDKAFDLGRFPWGRDTYALLLEYFERARPRAVTFDLILPEHDRSPQGADWDQELAEATRKLGNVIHAVDVNDTFQQEPDYPPARQFQLGGGVEEHRSVSLPYQELAAASRMLGSTFLILDADGPVRRSVPFVRQKDSYYPSLGLATAMVALGLSPSDVRLDGDGLHLGSTAMPLLDVEAEYIRPIDTRHMLIRYLAPPYADVRRTKTSYASYSFCDLFLSELQIRDGKKPEIDPAVFRDKIIFLGTTAAGLHDVFPTPFGAGGKMPGMQIHATVADNILSRSFLRPAGSLRSGLLVVVSTLVVAMFGVYLGFWRGLAAALAVAGGIGGVAAWHFHEGLWLSCVPAALGLIVAEFSSVGYKYFVEDRARREVKALFSRYVAPAVVKQLVEDPSKARLGGQRREMTVLFSDIRGFTTMTEAGRPEDVIRQLNEYLARMVDLLFLHHGTLDKFVGDMIMGLFNAPLDDPDHADHAVQMALAMLNELEALNRRWADQGKPALDIGVGINTGEMIVGNVGSERTLSYTVIGDNVNLGSRLESLNKEYRTHILISEATRAKLKGEYWIRPLGEAKVKGKTVAVKIFEVCRNQDEWQGKTSEAVQSERDRFRGGQDAP